MQVILLEKIRNLGNLGEKVKVKPGFGRNYLIPQGKAVSATETNLIKFEARRAELEKAEKETLAAAQTRAEAIEKLGSLTISAKAGEEGKLFGSIGARDIAEALAKAGCTIAKKEIVLPQGSIRMVGEYEVLIHLHSDVRPILKVNIVSGE